MAESFAPDPGTSLRRIERFVAQTNIKRVQHMLQQAQNAAEQRLIEELLAEEFKRLQEVENEAYRPAC